MPSLSDLGNLGGLVEGIGLDLGSSLLGAKFMAKLDTIVIIDASAALDSGYATTLSKAREQIFRDMATQAVSSLFGRAWDSIQSGGGTALHNWSSNAISGLVNLGMSAMRSDHGGVYRFNLNPQKIANRYRKVQTEHQHGFGYMELEYYGSDYITKTYNCTTGFLLPPAPIRKMGISDIRLSTGYIKLKELEKYYLNSSQKLVVVEFNTGYLGYLSDFDYNVDANNPRQMLFNLTFRLHPTCRFNILSGQRSDEADIGLFGASVQSNTPKGALEEAVAAGQGVLSNAMQAANEVMNAGSSIGSRLWAAEVPQL
jgi:hypothetical protein